VPIVCGWTREDASPFMLIEQHKTPDPNADMAPFREATESGMFEKGARSLVQRVIAAGQRAYLFQFAWNGPKTGLGDCHTIELPFLLGDRAAWQAAPMLKGADWGDIERLGRSMRSQWASFARSGDPSDRNMRWQPSSKASQPVNILA